MAYATATWGIVTRFEVARPRPLPQASLALLSASSDLCRRRDIPRSRRSRAPLARAQILVAVVLGVGFVSCLVCLNGVEVVPGIWAKDKEIWATAWSHENPNLRRKPVPEPQGDGYDPRRPDVKPRMFRSWAQQQNQL